MTDTPPADGTASEPTLNVTPTDPRIDDRLSITASGFAPDQRITINARFADLGTQWASDATFEADTDGRIDLTSDAPVAGAYDDVRPMGLVQFAERVGDAPVDTRTGTDTTQLELTARVDGEAVAEIAVARRVAPGVERVPLDPETEGLAGDCYVPAGDGPHPGVLALHGSGGEPAGRKARALAARGFVVLALRYFGGPDPVPEPFAEVPVSYVGGAIDFLHARDDVAAGDVGVIGASRGTELAFLTAAERDGVGVVVAYAPSAYAWFGEQDGEGPPPSAWRVDGDALPVLPHPGPDGRPEETDRGLRHRPLFEAFVEHAPDGALESVRLPVEEIAADVVLVSGGDDGVWHAGEMAEEVANAMTDAPGNATHHHFPDAGHSFFVPYHPTTERAVAETEDGPDVVHGGTPAGTADADRDSWTAALDALDALRA
ncbi:acyl-CoA thioesterase/bile acid-CoA:amino acid N-acyltransferase family protein [Halobacterium litoreum]|uniref:Acyl-CoA thioesterase/BAAT N-terminal domain-containing protein n=1 Tax=Halobacterium litoreum TaxID=2039234 RepID=A0ABD5NEC1_9EURY|nr:acyl-CoA thioesterase/bile acid-CoA:amino acid N-acyltransferase family protein [Halobacterium litoreum]UHH13721.1 acyl-CoA thioesterase/BAAT N-terminal domain-containing protein [Halobacterium litoreum]